MEGMVRAKGPEARKCWECLKPAGCQCGWSGVRNSGWGQCHKHLRGNPKFLSSSLSCWCLPSPKPPPPAVAIACHPPTSHTPSVTWPPSHLLSISSFCAPSPLQGLPRASPLADGRQYSHSLCSCPLHFHSFTPITLRIKSSSWTSLVLTGPASRALPLPSFQPKPKRVKTQSW